MNKDKKTKILMVDDDSLLFSIYSKKFDLAGYDFAVLNNAEGDFSDKVAGLRPSLILMDIDLKNHRNGVEAARALQADGRTNSIPIIFFTNGDLSKDAEAAKNMHPLGFFVKADFIPSELVAKVSEVYGEHLKNFPAGK